jgi:diguanylate cyclase (GGDEF)-like protein
VADAITAVIETMCETLGWDCGARWRWDLQGSVLRCADTWCADSRELQAFVASFSGQTFAPTAESGLIRKVWKSGAPTWIADVASEPGFLRAAAAAKAGLHGAFAFPIRIGSEVAGVMEFYSRVIRQPDDALLRVLDSIGLQIGQFIARRAAQEQLQQLAHFDYLTGLPNRNLFNQLLAHALAKAKRRGTRLAILFADLDGFKQVNDTEGHEVGDRVLREVARRLSTVVRGDDTVARRGGDEFAVLLRHVDTLDGVRTIVERVLHAVAQPILIEGREAAQVTASVGVALAPEQGREFDRLFQLADLAMYEAKLKGKNRYAFAQGADVSPATPPAVRATTRH